MKKFVIIIMMIITIMIMTGCSEKEKENVEPYSEIVINDHVTMKIESIELEEMKTENIEVENIITENVSKEYLEECDYNSQKNQW